MAQPPAYNRAFNFSNQQALTPSTPVPADQLDLEYNRVKQTLDAVLTNLALIQRDDGALANDSVGRDQLAAEVEVGFNVPSKWLTATAYTTADTVFDSNKFYRCLVSHTSGTFATDLAAGEWVEIADFSVLTQNADLIVYDNATSGLAATDAQAALDELASEKLDLAGGTMSGVLSMGSNRITNVTDPTSAQDAATKAFLTANYQPLDADLTAIAALSTTSYGRGLLTTANVAALTAALDAATVTLKGSIELATEAEAAARTDTGRAITPFNNPFPTGHLFGLTLSNNGTDATNDIDIAAGSARDGADDVNMILASALTKQLDAAWAVGTGAGGLDTGSIADTTYHVWLIKRSDTGVVDALFSTSASSPTMPTNYDYKRRIGSIVRSGGAILPFTQRGDEFLWDAAVIDVDDANPGTAAVTRTLTVPIGITVDAILSVGLFGGSNSQINAVVSSLAVSDQAAQATSTASLSGFSTFATTGGAKWGFGEQRVRTNTSGQIRTRQDASGASDRVGIITRGWIDTCGRLA